MKPEDCFPDQAQRARDAQIAVLLGWSDVGPDVDAEWYGVPPGGSMAKGCLRVPDYAALDQEARDRQFADAERWHKRKD